MRIIIGNTDLDFGLRLVNSNGHEHRWSDLSLTRLPKQTRWHLLGLATLPP